MSPPSREVVGRFLLLILLAPLPSNARWAFPQEYARMRATIEGETGAPRRGRGHRHPAHRPRPGPASPTRIARPCGNPAGAAPRRRRAAAVRGRALAGAAVAT